MRYLPLIAALMCGSAFADLVASRGGEVLRLDVSKPCAEKFVAEAVRDQYRAASSVIGKNHYRACWTPLKESKAALVMYDDGDYGVVPFGDLKNDPGV
jgi:hypothetical protein